MLTKYLLVLLLLFSATIGYSQIEREIAMFVDSTELKISNGKKLLVKCIKENDLNKASDVYSFVRKLSDKNSCSAFTIYEELFINCLIMNWAQWLDIAKGSEQMRPYYCSNSIYITEDVLKAILKQKGDSILNNISVLGNEEKQLIEIFIDLVKMDKIDESYSAKVKLFKKEYPKSEYAYFMKRYLPQSMHKGSMCFSVGSNMLVPTGTLGDYFNTIGAFAMSMDFNIGKVYASLYAEFGQAKLKQPIKASIEGAVHTFNKGNYFNYSEGGLLLGYFLVRNKYMHIAPYTIFGGGSIRSDLFDSNEQKESEELEIYNTFVTGGGLHTEFKLFDWNSRYYQYLGYDVKNHLSIKLDAGYNVITMHNRSDIKGDAVYTRLSLVWGMGSF